MLRQMGTSMLILSKNARRRLKYGIIPGCLKDRKPDESVLEDLGNDSLFQAFKKAFELRKRELSEKIVNKLDGKDGRIISLHRDFSILVREEIRGKNQSRYRRPSDHFQPRFEGRVRGR